jgi:endoglucanase
MRRLTRVAGGLTVLLLLADLGALTRNDPSPATSYPAIPPAVVVDARDFLDRYVAADGRVVRLDQGGDTVSEGQSYAMLLAVAVDDRQTFERVWAWTRRHLERDDGLLSWHWEHGKVVDPQPAADADLDAAWALALAARRWRSARFGAQSARLVRSSAALETSTMPDGDPVVVPGPWAQERQRSGDDLVLNPSYSSPVGEAVLVEAGYLAPAASEARLATMRALIAATVDRGDLPTDWLMVSPGGARGIVGPDDHRAGRYGWDAVRVPIRLAASCVEADRALAARMAPALLVGGGRPTMGDHPARLVAAASAAAAAGHSERAAALLDQASRGQAEAPTYYGGALVALGRALLMTDRLGGCPPAA